jgi:type VI secretion system secreted protein VgrG
MENARVSFEAGEAWLSIRHFHVEERMSGLFHVSLRAMSPSESLDLSSFVGARAEFTLAGASPRRFRGICERMAMVRTPTSGDEGLTTYELTLSPTMWRLTQRRGNRLFQHVTAPDIVTRLLNEHGVAHAWRIRKEAYPRLELRVQYDETDFAFASRLLEESGISFYFFDEGEHDATLILSDAPQANEPRPLPVPFVDDASLALGGRHEHITRLTLAEESRPGVVTLRDHDHLRPRFPLFASAQSDRPQEAALEQYHHAPGTFLHEAGAAAADLVAGATPVADDRGVARFDARFGAALAERRLEALHADRRTITFETSLHDLRPGEVLSILGHPRADLSPKHHFLTTRFVIDGETASPEKWTFRGTAVFTNRPYRPALSTPRPRLHGLQTAVVVGPGDDVAAVEGAALDAAATAARLVDNEIYVDEHGRVRVQFPWDREGRFDGDSSIWVRVSQGWAGGGYGLFTIPRVGHEVLVAFIDGDPDAPLVVGRVHNMVEPVPFKLPENATVSTWKTASSPGGDGFNELRFDDAAGREHVFLQGQKDMDHLVKNDFKEAVGRDRARSAQNDDVVAVGHDRMKVVNHDEIEATGLNRAAVVGLSRAATVGVEDSTHVGTRWSVTVARGLTGRLARELDQITAGPLGGVMRSAAATVLGLIPGSPLARAAESALAGFGGAALGRLRNVLSVLDGFETDPGPPPTSIEMVDRQIKLSTGEASIVLDGPNVTITAQGAITLHALKSVTVLGEEEVVIAGREKTAVISTTDDVIVQAKGNVHLNPYESRTAPPRAEPLGAAAGAPTPRCAVCGEALVSGEDGPACPDTLPPSDEG